MSTDARFYAAAIALVSGIYSIASALGGGMGMMSASVMLIVGVVVLLHGAVLLSPQAARLGSTSGPLMVVWAAIMLANQVVSATMGASMMASVDVGMIALAILMLASGLMMSGRRDPT